MKKYVHYQRNSIKMPKQGIGEGEEVRHSLLHTSFHLTDLYIYIYLFIYARVEKSLSTLAPLFKGIGLVFKLSSAPQLGRQELEFDLVSVGPSISCSTQRLLGQRFHSEDPVSLTERSEARSWFHLLCISYQRTGMLGPVSLAYFVCIGDNTW